MIYVDQFGTTVSFLRHPFIHRTLRLHFSDEIRFAAWLRNTALCQVYLSLSISVYRGLLTYEGTIINSAVRLKSLKLNRWMYLENVSSACRPAPSVNPVYLSWKWLEDGSRPSVQWTDLPKLCWAIQLEFRSFQTQCREALGDMTGFQSQRHPYISAVFLQPSFILRLLFQNYSVLESITWNHSMFIQGY